MRSRTTRSMVTAILFAGLALTFLPIASAANQSPGLPHKADPTHPGRPHYEKQCSGCHETESARRAAPLESLLLLPARAFEASAKPGGHIHTMSPLLTANQRAELIAYLESGRSYAEENFRWLTDLMCPEGQREVDLRGEATWTTFGADRRGSRQLSSEKAGLSKVDLSNLEVAWAIGDPYGFKMSQAPLHIGNTVFFSTTDFVMALDDASGCAKWLLEAGESRSPLTFARIDQKPIILHAIGREVMAINATTGDVIWRVSGQPLRGDGGEIRGGVVAYGNKVIVPISASGVRGGGDYCCTGHGAVVALSLRNGRHFWEYHTMEEATDNGEINADGQPMRGPSGAPIWAQPTIDSVRKRVIVVTGENTSLPTTDTSDSIISLDLETGDLVWKFQAMPNDAWNIHCRTKDEDSGPNCPWHWQDDNTGRDFDFGSQPVLTRQTINGETIDVLLAGQKSGHLWALNAETGDVLWFQRVGVGTSLGGNHWGLATDDELVFFPVNDPIYPHVKEHHPGMYAFRISDGSPVWSYEAKSDCDGERGERMARCEMQYGFSATPLVIGEVLLAPTLDGKLFMFDAKSGEILSVFDTTGDYETINGVEARGGAIDAHALAAGRGVILLGSGYGAFGQQPGNVFLALKPATPH